MLVAYVILHEDCKQKDDFQKLLSDPDTLLLQNIDAQASVNAVKSYLDVDQIGRASCRERVSPRV